MFRNCVKWFSSGTTYQWLPLTNDVFSLEPNNIPNPTFYSDSIGVYELYLTVWDDDHGCSDVDTCSCNSIT
ncbi:MAG: hypothetical protein R2801_04550 [Chitinophagales bacterium]